MSIMSMSFELFSTTSMDATTVHDVSDSRRMFATAIQQNKTCALVLRFARTSFLWVTGESITETRTLML
jgi:hypothetical protein